MQKIQLGRTGHVALVDDSDYPELSNHKWTIRHHRRTAYAEETRTCCNGAQRQMHRLLMSAERGQQVDHRDGNGLNNQRSNLRLASNSENAANRRKQASASRFKGVWLERATGKWRALVKKDGQRRYLGAFVREEDAALAYDAAARRLFGEFAALNFPLPGERSAHLSIQDFPEVA